MVSYGFLLLKQRNFLNVERKHYLNYLRKCRAHVPSCKIAAPRWLGLLKDVKRPADPNMYNFQTAVWVYNSMSERFKSLRQLQWINKIILEYFLLRCDPPYWQTVDQNMVWNRANLTRRRGLGPNYLLVASNRRKIKLKDEIYMNIHDTSRLAVEHVNINNCARGGPPHELDSWYLKNHWRYTVDITDSYHWINYSFFNY